MAEVYEIDFEPGMVLDNRDLPFVYTRVGNGVQVKRNLEFIEKKKVQCIKHLEFMLRVIILERMSQYIQTYTKQYTEQINEMNQHYQEFSITVGPKISELKQKLAQSHDEFLKMKKEDAEQVTLKKLKQSTIRRALSKTEQKVELAELAVQNAEREAEVKKHENILGSYQQIADQLTGVEADLKGRYRKKIDEMNLLYGANRAMFDSLFTFLKDVKKQEANIFSLSRQEEFAIAAEAHLNMICANFENLKAQVIDSQIELHNIKQARELVGIQEGIVGKRIEIALEEALQPRIIFFRNVKITEYQVENQKFLILKSRDRGAHLQRITQVTQNNMLTAQRCLKDLDVIPSHTTDHFVVGLTSSNVNTVDLTYIDTIIVRRQNPVMQLIDPKNVPLELDTKHQLETVNQIIKQIEELDMKLQKLKQLKHDLAELQIQPEMRKQQLESEQSALARALQQLSENFKLLVQKAGQKIQDQKISQFAIGPVLGVITQTLVMQPESCMGDGQEKQHLYLQVSHSWFMKKAAEQANELNPRPPRSRCCTPSSSSLVFGLNEYPVIKAVELILHHELIGAIRNDDGGMQRIERRIRTCNIDHHMVQFIRSLCQVCLQDFMVSRRIDELAARAYLQKYYDMFQDTKRGNLHARVQAM